MATGYGIGVEIVVDVQTVDIVTAHNVGRHITDVALVFDLTRVENDESVVREEAVGFEPIGGGWPPVLWYLWSWRGKD